MISLRAFFERGLQFYVKHVGPTFLESIILTTVDFWVINWCSVMEEGWSKKLEVKRNGLYNSITMLRGPLKGGGLFAKSPLLPSTKNILKEKTKGGPSMKASWLIIFFYWNGKWPWQCSGLHNALKGITMAKMQTWQKIPTLRVLMILKTFL